MTEQMNDENAQPKQAKIKRHGRFSWIWLIPMVAASLVVYLAYTSYSHHGPSVTVTFSTASGLQVEQTLVKHKAVPLGTVEGIDLAPDMTHVIVHIRMNGEADGILTDHARFWVVRPRLSAGSLTGIETLVSGAYIEVDPGAPGGKKQRSFQGLEEPPGRQSDEPGRVFTLQAARLGSLSVGAPIYNRDVEVGEVLSSDLGDQSKGVSLRIFVREPYDKLVHADSRFWNTSGLAVTMGAEGMHIELESIQALLSGAITFETPATSADAGPADDGSKFHLYEDKARADAASYRENIPYVSYFETSVQGLSQGSPVQLFGVQVGNVSGVTLVYDADKHRMVARVAFNLQPDRVLSHGTTGAVAAPDVLRRALSESGLRAQLESSSFLTGAKDIAILWTPGNKASELPREGDAIVLPGEGGGLDGLTASLSDVAAKVDKIPFEKIGESANSALASVQQLASNVDTNATPALKQLPLLIEQLNKTVESAGGAMGPGGYGQNSEFQHGMERAMNQVNDAARSFRALADYLDRHPEALIRGRASSTDSR